MRAIGDRIREFRGMRKLTVRRLAEEAETSPSMISQIENGKTSAGFATLVRIADALGVSLGDLVAENLTTNGSRLVRKAARPDITWGTSSSKYLITPRPFQHVEAYELVLTAGDKLGELTYGDTSVLIIVIAGRGTVTVSGSAEILDEGDSTSFWTSEPHSLSNEGPDLFRAILVLTPPALPVKKDETR